MAQPALTASETLAWLEKTSTKWQELIESNPEILNLPCDVVGVSAVGGLLQHIVAVELRYAERLARLPATDYAVIPFDSAESIYAVHRTAMKLFTQQLEGNVDWEERIEFVTRSMGPARSTRKSILFHAMLHGIRHYAQLAMMVRQSGVKPDWPMDFLFMDIERA